MIYLLLSILTSSIAVLFFKLFERAGVNTFQAIIFNYFTCAVLGNLVTGDQPVIASAFWQQPWFPYTLMLGVCFISIFFTIGKTAQKLGVSVSMVAAKLSVVVPVLFAVLFYAESLGAFQVMGILLSLASVYLISKKDNSEQQPFGKALWLLPVIVFAGSGVIDTIFNYLTKEFNPSGNDLLFGAHTVTTAFSTAFVIGTSVLGYQVITGKTRLTVKNALWGVALGIPNYYCMYFLVKTLETYSAESAMIMPVNNIGIVIVSTLASVVFFRERMNQQNIGGLVLAILSIALISLF